ncbi:5-oxoprolinase subunit PxpB [Aquimarina sp. 2201CG5-10]|uniref:5-oxoprolinase subunit PxpB n=1 Tax=Aquimarina callyspongiae TaxID=3098150 RepID=UPI002AB4DBCD|nr:5-oxoprolinase subunit PxpB [Aquimarina sp. 2201CG5-10]MDY8138073.1 5-oxoprolinase subunit PxpB [Aquimarina sp. 2201CG5-10]
MKYKLQYKRYAENAILIEWPSEINEILLEDVLFYKKAIEILYDKLIVEVISSYNSLLIYYISAIKDLYSEVLKLKTLYSDNASENAQKKTLWKIPICYSSNLAPDLDEFAQEKSLTIDEVIALHASPIYTVYFIGFLPGFLYLGGLKDELILPRKTTPSLSVEKGSVAIGGSQTGVYPSNSPGGWHVIGKTPLNFFDPKSDDPCFVNPGDKIQFIAIEEKKYNDINMLLKEGVYVIESENV